MRSIRPYLAVAALLPLAAVPVDLRAAPLEPAACEQLRQDIGALEKAGARIALSKGAAWAKTNLKPDQVQQVERLIDAEAQFTFRCPQPKRQFDPATEAMMEHGTGSDPDPDAAPAETPAAKPAPARKKSAAQAAPAAATDGTAAPEPPLAPRPKRAAAKPKPADAFVPPPAPVAQ